ncbi:MAG TPA: type II toxin-antitoxin system RelE/ParE family toxin [Anaerolineales bacterium]|nr:type II toxin-antitoxin system RelE/ParE family toxin [Anaerolineales bacterium]
MHFSFNKKRLEDLYYKEKGAHKYPPEVVNAFFHVMAIIEAAVDIRDFYNLKSLHFEKLKGDRREEHSMRLNKQYRLTMRLEKEETGTSLLILDIEDYHD